MNESLDLKQNNPAKRKEEIMVTAPSPSEEKNIEKMLEKYSYLVKRIAHKMIKKLPLGLVTLDNLISIGMEGLYEAIEKYDNSRNVLFEKYAGFKIEKAMIDFLRSLSFVAHQTHEKGSTKFISLDKLGNKLFEELHDKNDPFFNVSAKEITEKISQAIEKLTPREKAVMNLYYRDGLTQKEISQELGIHEVTVSVIHRNAIKNIRKKLKNIIAENRDN